MKRNLLLIFICLLIISGVVLWSYVRPALNVHYTLDTVPTTNVAAPVVVPRSILPELLFLNTGDVMFDRGVRKVMATGVLPLENMKSIKLAVGKKYGKEVDITAVNLEGPITDNPTCQNKPYSFKFASTTGTMLKEHGIDLVALSNNHSFDCFAKGVTDTRKNLSEAGVMFSGGGSRIGDSTVLFQKNGINVAFVSIDETIRTIPIESFYPLIKNLASTTDLVIVNIHWGVEYQKLPSKIQKDIGHRLIDSGAHAVVGHHPHVVEPMELYHGGVIYYSLGNFIFDQVGEEVNKGAIAGILFEKSTTTNRVIIKDAIMLPVQITKSVPQLVE